MKGSSQNKTVWVRWIVVSLLLAMRLTPFAQTAADSIEANLTGGCVETFDASADYFPEKIGVEHAQNFSVEYFNRYKIVSMKPWPGAE